MESFTKNLDLTEGVEVLFFPEAEIKKTKGFATVFATSGPLSVLYFKEYSRYVLKINDWKYPLLRRIPIVAAENNTLAFATYMLPTLHGFTFTLTIDLVACTQARANFEAILRNNCTFAQSKFEPFRKVDLSPDDKLSRSIVQSKPITKEVISEVVNEAVETVKEVAQTVKTDIKNITSSKTNKKINLKELKTKNFKKSATPSIKREIIESSEKSTREFSKMRMENPYLKQEEQFNDVEILNKSSLPSVMVDKGDLEEAILRNKDLAVIGNFFQPVVRPAMTKGFGDIVGEVFQDLKDMIVKPFEPQTSVTNSRVGQGPMEAHARKPIRLPKTQTAIYTGPPTTGLESMTHYQG